MSKQSVWTDKIPKSANPFSLGIKANGFLFVSGQVGKDKNGKIVDGFSGQVHQTMENIKLIIETAGSSMSDVVMATIYITDIALMPEMNEIYRQYFDGDFPARATVEVSRLGQSFDIEIAVVALCE